MNYNLPYLLLVIIYLKKKKKIIAIVYEMAGNKEFDYQIFCGECLLKWVKSVTQIGTFLFRIKQGDGAGGF